MARKNIKVKCVSRVHGKFLLKKTNNSSFLRSLKNMTNETPSPDHFGPKFFLCASNLCKVWWWNFEKNSGIVLGLTLFLNCSIPILQFYSSTSRGFFYNELETFATFSFKPNHIMIAWTAPSETDSTEKVDTFSSRYRYRFK